MTIAASVVICTHNRAAELSDALGSLARQAGPLPPWEVIVVDNGSSDHTVDVVKAAKAWLPNLSYAFEGRLGLSVARNRGIAEANGAIVAFLDDDALADPGWVRGTLAAFEAEDVLAVAGRISLRWERPRPAWLPDALEGYYTKLELGDQPFVLPPPRYPLGANMSIRAGTLAAVGGFRSDLGRRGSRGLLSNEEKDLFARVRALGGTIVYAPDSYVHHRVAPERVSLRWLARRLFEQGRSEARLAPAPAAGDRRGHLLAAGLGLVRAVGGGKRWLLREVRRSGPLRALVFELTRASRWLGYAGEHARLALRPAGTSPH